MNINRVLKLIPYSPAYPKSYTMLLMLYAAIQEDAELEQKEVEKEILDIIKASRQNSETTLEDL